MSHLFQNIQDWTPNNAYASGGSFAAPKNTSEMSLVDMFSPASSMRQNTNPILDPYAGQMVSRFEIPDTVSSVNLGQAVIFKLQSDQPNYIIQEILPITDWGYSLRTFKWDVWLFPQRPVYPTPETAPPRYLASTRISQSTTMIRFAIGQHMSEEYKHTPLGQTNERYNLKQMALSVAACLENLALERLFNAHREGREILEKLQTNSGLGSYRSADVKKTMKDEVANFARPLKEEYGFIHLYEDQMRIINGRGGSVNSAILTRQLNTLVTTRPELTKFSEAGPDGPARVNNPGRSFMSNGITTYYMETHPERFGVVYSQWQRLRQIGNYHKSLELPEVRQHSDEYCASYNSKMRSINIYNVLSNAFFDISVEEMLGHSNIFGDDGRLLGIDEFKNPDDYSGNHQLPPNSRDFLTFEAENTLPTQPTDIDGKDRVVSTDQLPAAVEVFGQLRLNHFTPQDCLEVGTMLSARIAASRNISLSALSKQIQDGLDLYQRLCKAPFSSKFVELAVMDVVRKNYERKQNTKLRAVQKIQPGGPLWEDNRPKVHSYETDTTSRQPRKKDKDTSSEVIDEAAAEASIGGYDQSLILPDNQSYIPLPPVIAGYLDAQDYANMSGFASYDGFRAMAAVAQTAQPPYNREDLIIARDFVTALDLIGEKLTKMLPGCECLSMPPDADTSSGVGRMIAERMLNMVGFPITANIQFSKYIQPGSSVLAQSPILTLITQADKTAIRKVNEQIRNLYFPKLKIAELITKIQRLRQEAMQDDATQGNIDLIQTFVEQTNVTFPNTILRSALEADLGEIGVDISPLFWSDLKLVSYRIKISKIETVFASETLPGPAPAEQIEELLGIIRSSWAQIQPEPNAPLSTTWKRADKGVEKLREKIAKNELITLPYLSTNYGGANQNLLTMAQVTDIPQFELDARIPDILSNLFTPSTGIMSTLLKWSAPAEKEEAKAGKSHEVDTDLLFVSSEQLASIMGNTSIITHFKGMVIADTSFLNPMQEKFRTQQEEISNGKREFFDISWQGVKLLTSKQRLSFICMGPFVKKDKKVPTTPGITPGIIMKSFVTRSFAQRIQQMQQMEPSPVHLIASLAFMTTPFTKTACLALVRNNVRLPINFIVVRPHQNFIMEAMIMCNRGMENLGFTAIAGTDYAASSTTLTKEFYGHLSFWAAVIIMKPQNVHVVHNLVPVGIGSGNGVGWFDPLRGYNTSALGDHREPEDPLTAPSLMALAIPFTENPTMEWLSITGKLQQAGGNPDSDAHTTSMIVTAADRRDHYSTAARYNAIWGWRRQADSHITESMGFEDNLPLFNIICYGGLTRYYGLPDSKTGATKLSFATREKGHKGENFGGVNTRSAYLGQPARIEPLDWTGLQIVS